jgi:hypothetical protein
VKSLSKISAVEIKLRLILSFAETSKVRLTDPKVLDRHRAGQLMVHGPFEPAARAFYRQHTICHPLLMIEAHNPTPF